MAELVGDVEMRLMDLKRKLARLAGKEIERVMQLKRRNLASRSNDIASDEVLELYLWHWSFDYRMLEKENHSSTVL